MRRNFIEGFSGRYHRSVRLSVFSSARFADHVTPPGHPERVSRGEVLISVAADLRSAGADVVEPRPATDDELLRVHDADYLTLLRETAGRAVALDPDTFTSPDSYAVARLAAGAATGAVDAVFDGGSGTRAFALVRPPGHHAERARAMGFCFFNNIAVAAAHARARGVARVAIVDYDVHHGNGTQASFYDDPNVLFISSHQYPYYPGTGAASDTGTGRGRGFTVNLPLPAGATDADYERVFRDVAFPVLRQFAPELILVSAGFDAHADDPLGGMRLTAGEFVRLTAAIGTIADDCCKGRVVALTEGGYDLKALADCTRAVGFTLGGEAPDVPAAEGDTARAAATIAAVVPGLRAHWKL
jgi:acetoin utilization deacetylase AcuC-like enzyme